MSPHTIGAIAMHTTGNEQVGHYCMSLNTGRLLNRNNATYLPIPRNVINHVHRITHRDPVGITFANRNNVAFPDISDDDEAVDVSESDSDDSYNDDDPSEAADPDAEDPEDSVDITGVDDQ